jgi:Tol biopolymer transport system component
MTLVGDDVLATMPIWSPDGRAIAYAHQTALGRSRIRIVDLTDGRVSSLPAGAGLDVPTSWH